MTTSLDFYNESPRPSMKHLNYFNIYDHEFNQFRGKSIVFAEVGVLDGGSLFMWRDFFGPSARIIGIDLNPEALKWQEFGFEIHIGDQSDPTFWAKFFKEVGEINLLLDDGGHTNLQQITTVISAIPFIADGGKVMVEDTHSGYLAEFGNPSKATLNEFAKLGSDSIQARFPGLAIRKSEFSKAVWAITFFESITVFHINRKLCRGNSATSNNGVLLDHKPNSDFRYNKDSWALQAIKLINKIALLEFRSVGGSRSFLRPLNVFIDNPKKRKFLRLLFYPAHITCKFLLNTDMYFRNRFLRFRFRKYFHNIA
jgi:hypothetical protein